LIAFLQGEARRPEKSRPVYHSIEELFCEVGTAVGSRSNVQGCIRPDGERAVLQLVLKKISCLFDGEESERSRRIVGTVFHCAWKKALCQNEP